MAQPRSHQGQQGAGEAYGSAIRRSVSFMIRFGRAILAACLGVERSQARSSTAGDGKDGDGKGVGSIYACSRPDQREAVKVRGCRRTTLGCPEVSDCLKNQGARRGMRRLRVRRFSSEGLLR